MFLLMEHGVEHNIWDGRFGLLPHKSQFTHPHERLPSSLHGRAQCLSRQTHDIKALIENAMGLEFIFMWVNRQGNSAAHSLAKWGSQSFFGFFNSSESSSKFLAQCSQRGLKLFLFGVLSFVLLSAQGSQSVQLFLVCQVTFQQQKKRTHDAKIEVMGGGKSQSVEV